MDGQALYNNSNDTSFAHHKQCTDTFVNEEVSYGKTDRRNQNTSSCQPRRSLSQKAVPEAKKVDNDELVFTPDESPADQPAPTAETVETLLKGSLRDNLTEEELASLKALLKKGGAL